MAYSLLSAESMVALCRVVGGAVETAASAAVEAAKTLVGGPDFKVLQFNLRRSYQTRPEEVPHRRFTASAAGTSLPGIQDLDLGLGAWMGVEIVSRS